MSGPREDDDLDYWVDETCECELDWNCGRHGYRETPEDRIATWWSQDHP